MTWRRILLAILGLALLCFIVPVAKVFVPYFLADYLYEGIQIGDSRKQVESRLWMASGNGKPGEPIWFKGETFKEGEVLHVYFVLGDRDAPIEVLYDKDQKVVSMMGSYQ